MWKGLNKGQDVGRQEKKTPLKEGSWSLMEAHGGRLNFRLLFLCFLLMAQRKKRSPQKCNEVL